MSEEKKPGDQISRNWREIAHEMTHETSPLKVRALYEELARAFEAQKKAENSD